MLRDREKEDQTSSPECQLLCMSLGALEAISLASTAEGDSRTSCAKSSIPMYFKNRHWYACSLDENSLSKNFTRHGK